MTSDSITRPSAILMHNSLPHIRKMVAAAASMITLTLHLIVLLLSQYMHQTRKPRPYLREHLLLALTMTSSQHLPQHKRLILVNPTYTCSSNTSSRSLLKLQVQETGQVMTRPLLAIHPPARNSLKIQALLLSLRRLVHHRSSSQSKLQQHQPCLRGQRTMATSLRSKSLSAWDSTARKQ